jgi:two-component system NtrC family response regulator
MRWLIADDDPIDRAVAIRAIRDGDPTAHIVEASTGARAIRELDARHFDAVLTDVRMPGGASGHDVVAVARALGVGVICVMTGLTGLAPLDVRVIEKGAGLRVVIQRMASVSACPMQSAPLHHHAVA